MTDTMTDNMTDKQPTGDWQPSNPPDLEAAAAELKKFCLTVASLRDPQRGCPWDLKQDHKSLRSYMIEEAYEASHAMGEGDPAGICDELGDVLLQVVLNSQIALDDRKFSLVEVIQGINGKMRRRHPHVFAAEGDPVLSVAEVRSNWDAIKALESGRAPGSEPVFAGALKKSPATTQALKIGRIAAKIDFDWGDAGAVFGQVESEIDELRAEIQHPAAARDRIADEIGDVFFSLSQLCRHLDLDPEVTFAAANQKFLKRFAKVEELARAQGIDVCTAGQAALERLWQQAKAINRPQD